MSNIEAGKKANPPSETRSMQVTFYRHGKDKEPTFVIANGRAYRAETEACQEETAYFLKAQDIRAKLLERLDEETYELLWDLENAVEKNENAHVGRLCQELIEHLPKHEPVIEHVFLGTDIDGLEEHRHEKCILPERMVYQGEEDQQ